MINKNSIIYQLVTDRFDNDEGNLEQIRYDPDYESKLTKTLGGTFKGIERRADYLTSLGVTHIMISPVERCKKSCYHAYATTRQGLINLNFGGNRALKKMVTEFKEREIGIILDFPGLATGRSPILRVARQSSMGCPERERFLFKEFLDNPSYGEELQKLTSRVDCGRGDYFYFCTHEMPMLNLSNDIVFKEQAKRITNLIKKYGFSDVRIDMGHCWPERTLSLLKDYIGEKVGKEVSILSENWPHPIHEFNGGELFGLCDGEFNLKGTILFNNWGREPQLIERIREHFFRTKGKSDMGYVLATGIDNHDLPRFKGDEPAQRIASLFQFTLPNFTPIVYYGNESLMQNEGQEHFSLGRGIMRFNHTPLLEHYKALIAFRRKHDFQNAKLSNFQIYDTHSGTNYNDQLVTFNLDHSINQRHHIVINRSENEKPVMLEQLVHDVGVIPKDIITGQELTRIEDGRFILDKRKGYLLPNQKN
jgi:glycosidase